MKRILLLLSIVLAVVTATSVLAVAQTADCFDYTTEEEGACPDPVVNPSEVVPLSSGGGTGTDSLGLVAIEYIDGTIESRNVGRGKENAAVKKIKDTEPNVKSVEADYGGKPDATNPNDPLYGSIPQTNLKNNPPGYPAGWDTSNGGSKSAGEVTAVLDSGYDHSHPDLAANIIGEKDFVNGDSIADPDATFHGTATNSIANAITNNSVGMAGAMWGGNSIHGKVCYFDVGLDRDACPYADMAAGIDWVIEQKNAGVNVKQINMSIGGNDDLSVLSSAVGRANTANILIVASAGNEHHDLNAANGGIPHFPACYPGVLGVGAASKDGSRPARNLAGNEFSNWDSSTATDKCLDVYAPGEAILAAMPTDGSECLTTSGEPYCNTYGTSFAVPHVAATSAQVRDKNPSFTRSQTFSRIVNKARNRTYATPGTEKFLSDKCALKPSAKGC